MSQVVFKCGDCGNLHGARVEACGMCGSANVALASDEAATPTPRNTGGDFYLPPSVETFLASAADMFDAAAACFRANTPDVEDEDDQHAIVDG